MKSPTSQLYDSLQEAFLFFNENLFDSELPQVVFTFQRKKSVMGYFSADRWSSKEGEFRHEVAINPAYIGQAPLIELFQTLCHEFVHLWQECHGTPSRRAYHNKEWSEKMVSIGLIPSTDGTSNGKRTGEKMSDYPESGGLFIRCCEQLVSEKKFDLFWIDRVLAQKQAQVSNEVKESLRGVDDKVSEVLLSIVSDDLDGDIFLEPEGPSKTKSRYSCGSCEINVWGKKDLRLICADCSELLIEKQA
jgi:predicted SprT family Zn-dependent metalloprotease